MFDLCRTYLDRVCNVTVTRMELPTTSAADQGFPGDGGGEGAPTPKERVPTYYLAKFR